MKGGRAAVAAALALAGCRAAPTADRPAANEPATAVGVITVPAVGHVPVNPLGTVVIESVPPATTPMPGLPRTPGVPVAVADAAPNRLTTGGCCVRPFWRADGRALRFIDRPPDGGGGEGVTGIYEVSLDGPADAPPALVSETIGTFSPDQRWRIDLAAGRTTLARLADGASFEVPAGGRGVTFSPGGDQIAWQADNPNASFERQVARIMVASPDGTGAREVTRLSSGSLVDWLGEDALLVRARANADGDSDIDVLSRQPLAGGPPAEILRAPRMRGLALSPDRRRLAYSVSGAADTNANGLWLAALDGSTPPRRLDDLFGAYRWRDARRLVVVPFDVGAASMRLVELDAATLAARPLTDPAAQPFRIEGGDWSVSPDGRTMAFVSADDRNIWTIALAD